MLLYCRREATSDVAGSTWSHSLLSLFFFCTFVDRNSRLWGICEHRQCWLRDWQQPFVWTWLWNGEMLSIINSELTTTVHCARGQNIYILYVLWKILVIHRDDDYNIHLRLYVMNKLADHSYYWFSGMYSTFCQAGKKQGSQFDDV